MRRITTPQEGKLMDRIDAIIVIGAGGHAKVIIDIIEKQAKHIIIGVLDNSATGTIMGYPILGPDSIATELASKIDNLQFIIAVGDNSTRQEIALSYERTITDIKFGKAIHPSAQIGKGAVIGCGTVVMAGAIINADCHVGCHVIINTKASIDHDSVMQDFASLAPGATTGGNCTIEECSAIGIGATLKHGIRVGKNTVVGAGSVVIANCEPNSTYYGVPSKKIKIRNKNDRYL